MNSLTLGESLEVLIDHRGKTPKKLGSEFTPRGVPVASAILVSDGRLNLVGARCVSAPTWREWMPVPTRKGDVLLTSEAPLGRVARVPSDDPLVLGQRLYGLRGKEGVLDSGFLYYALQTERVRADLIGRSTGTTVFGIRQSALRQVVIPAPHYEAQRAIAEVLGALDDKIAANARVRQVAADLAVALFERDVANSSHRKSLGELVAEGSLTLGDGYRTKKGEHGQPGLRILRAGDIQDGQIVATGSDFVAAEYRRQMGAKASEPGDIVLTTKGSVGRVAVYPGTVEQTVYSPQLCFFRPIPEGSVGGGLLATWFRTKDFERQAATVMYKSDMAPYISLADIRTMSVPLLLPEAQATSEARLCGLIELMAVKANESRGLADLRDALLPQLMSGKIGVRDAERVVEGVV